MTVDPGALTATSRRHRSTVTGAVAWVLVGVPVVIAAVGPLLTLHDPVRTSADVLAPPSSTYLLGTDHLGRDVLSRTLAGGRSVLGVAAVAVVLAEIVGVALGMLAGYARRFGRGMLLGGSEVLLAIPPVVLLGALAAGLGRSAWLLLAGVTVALVPSLVPLVATATLTRLGQPWLESAVLAGESSLRILFGEVLPSLRSVVAADAGMRLLSAVFLVSTAGFLGFGPVPPTPDWGLMIAEATDTMGRQPWPVVAPAVLLVSFAVGVNRLARRLSRGWRP